MTTALVVLVVLTIVALVAGVVGFLRDPERFDHPERRKPPYSTPDRPRRP